MSVDTPSMAGVTYALARGLVKRLRSQSGMTIVETMVAAVILTAGVLGVFVMVETADKVNTANRGREAATSISREVLEKSHSTVYGSIGDSSWLDATLAGLSGGTGQVVSPAAGAARTDVTRRGKTYTITTETCSVDDSKDGLKASVGTIRWCNDSLTTGAGDSQPEDLKRVGVTAQWTEGGKTHSIYQASTFSSAGSVVGPSLTEFKITSPTGLDPVAPTVTTNGNGKVVFQASSIGAGDMKFTVDGVAQTTGIAGGANGVWTFDWNIVPLKDGMYTIGATAIDPLGTAGDPQYIQVKLARGAATAVKNVAGGYNDVYASNTKKRVVELGWDASPEGSVTGYEVLKGATVVCEASLNLECMDLSPASSGNTTYTIKTLYTDSAGNTGSVSTNYTVAAPSGGGSGSKDFWFQNSASITQTGCLTPPTTHSRPGAKTDLMTTAPAGTEVLWTYNTHGNLLAGCMAPFTSTASISAQAGAFVVSGYFRNQGNRICKLQWVLQKGTNYMSASLYGGNAIGGSVASMDIPAGMAAAQKFTQNLNTVAGTFAAGDQLTISVGGFGSASTSNNCSSTTMYWNSAARPLTATVNSLTGGGGGGGGSSITRPAAPAGLAGTANGDGTTTLTWTPPTGTPSAEFYRIYRDGQDYTSRLDTTGDTGLGTIQWTDTSTGGTTHIYRITAASLNFAESDFVTITR